MHSLFDSRHLAVAALASRAGERETDPRDTAAGHIVFVGEGELQPITSRPASQPASQPASHNSPAADAQLGAGGALDLGSAAGLAGVGDPGLRVWPVVGQLVRGAHVCRLPGTR